jgi:hypothetical protein
MLRIAVIVLAAAATVAATTAAAQTAAPVRTIVLNPAAQPQAAPGGSCARCAPPAGKPAKPQKHAAAPQLGW